MLLALAFGVVVLGLQCWPELDAGLEEAQQAAFIAITNECETLASDLYWADLAKTHAERASVCESIAAKAEALTEEIGAAVDRVAVLDWMQTGTYDRDATTLPSEVCRPRPLRAGPQEHEPGFPSAPRSCARRPHAWKSRRRVKEPTMTENVSPKKLAQLIARHRRTGWRSTPKVAGSARRRCSATTATACGSAWRMPTAMAEDGVRVRRRELDEVAAHLAANQHNQVQRFRDYNYSRQMLVACRLCDWSKVARSENDRDRDDGTPRHQGHLERVAEAVDPAP